MLTCFKRLPPQALRNDVFYLRPLVKFSRDDDSVWFTAVSIGRNKLAMLMKEMCRNGGIAGTKSNHSLCVTGVTELYRAGVPEKIIKQRTQLGLDLSRLRNWGNTSLLWNVLQQPVHYLWWQRDATWSSEDGDNGARIPTTPHVPKITA